MKQVGLRLEEELIKELKQRAVNLDTTVQDIVTKAIKLYLDPSYEKYHEVKLGDFTLRLTNKEYSKLANRFAKILNITEAGE